MNAAGRRVLLVEEEALLRVLLADMLIELGYEIAAETGSLGEAMTLARDADFDLAILDVLMNGEVSYPVAEIVAARGLPFMFASGLSPGELPGKHRSRPLLRKPFQIETLRAALVAALGP